MSTISKKGSKSKPSKKSKYNRPHVIIPQEDWDWVLEQSPAVYKLWGECWRCDPYGSRLMQLNTSLAYSTFMSAKKTLKESGLFLFERKTSILDSRETVCWQVINLHGARVKSFWQSVSTQSASNSELPESNSSQSASNSHSLESIYTKTQSQQPLSEPSVTHQEHFSNSSKEVLKCENEILSPTVAPLGGVPTAVVLELERELTLQEIDTILESAANGVCPTLETIKPLMRSGQSQRLRILVDDNPQWGIDLADYPIGDDIVIQRVKLRSQRKEKLKKYALVKEHPPVEFLRECSQDPVLAMMVRKFAKLQGWSTPHTPH